VNWRQSTNPGGSPGADDPTPPLAVHINEVLANSEAPDVDWVELYNPNDQSVDISHWWLSDNNTTPQKFRIPEGTIIPAGAYLVFTENDFATGLVPFGFSSNGERARLSAGDAGGALTGFVDNWSFEASDIGSTFGRVVNSVGADFFVRQKEATPGLVNAGPAVGPVVISELMYNPATGGDEFVEIRNITDAPVPLFDPANPANTWLTDGFTYPFPPGVTLQAGEIVLLAPIAPELFRSKYSIPAAVRIFGPYSGALSNGGEKITLQRPGVPYTDDLGATVVPPIDVDSVTYADAAPWPASADGGGPSLERISLGGFGDDPQNWRASVAGGNAGSPPALSFADWQGQYFDPSQAANPEIGGAAGDPDGDDLDNFSEWAYGSNPWQAGAEPVELYLETVGPDRFLSLRVRYSLGALGLVVSGDTAADADAWVSGAAVAVGSPEVQGDGTAILILRNPNPVDATARHFLRARFSAP
jgi:hypothetical protein